MKKARPKRTDKQRLCTIDIETDPFTAGRTPRPFLVNLFDGIEHFSFWGENCCADFAAWLFSAAAAPARALIYAHNGGEFDFHYLFPPLAAQNAADLDRKTPEILWLRGGLAKFRFNERLVEFRDSLLILPVPLADLDAGKKRIDFKKLEKSEREKHKSEITEYCRADCEALRKAVERYREDFGQHFTIGGSALKMAQDMGGFKLWKNKREHFDATHRKHYFAGRCQAFQRGEFRGLIKCFDLRSAYPWAMTLPLWHGFDSLETTKEPTAPKRLAASLLTVRGTSAGAFPVRIEDPTGELEGRVIYPHATGEFKVTGAELVAARETGTFKGETIRASVPQEMATFEKFIEWAWKRRASCQKKGDKMGDLFHKLLMNNLSGKLATNPREMKEFMTLAEMEEDPETLKALLAGRSNFLPAGTIGEGPEAVEIVSKPMPEDRWQFLNVATAATITGHVRARLLRAIMSSETPPIYCDTDSLFYQTPEPNNKKRSLTWQNWTPFPLGEDLGEWREDSRGDLLAVGREKLYALRRPGQEWKTASAGAELSFREIIRAVRGLRVEHHKDAPTFCLNGIKQAIFIKRSFEVKKNSEKKFRKTLDVLKKMGFSEIVEPNTSPKKIT